MKLLLLLPILFLFGCQESIAKPEPVEIIMLVVYDDAALDLNPDIVNDIKTEVLKTNKVLENSGLTDVAYFSAVISKVETTFIWPGDNINANESLIANTEVATLRNKTKADIVIGINARADFFNGTAKLFVDDGRVTAWTFYTYTELTKEAYAIVSINLLLTDDHVFSHEVFHLFGLQHDLVTSFIDFNVSDVYPYAHGYRNDPTCTIMARVCQRQLILSNELPDGNRYYSDNIQRFIETVAIIGEFR